MIEVEKKKRKKIASIYEITENVEKENAENSDDGEEEKLSEDNEAAIIPYQPILMRPVEDMNHCEAQEECGESLMLMFDQVRQQT